MDKLITKPLGTCTECTKLAIANVRTLGGSNLKVCEYHRRHYMHHMEQERQKLLKQRRGGA